MLKLFAITNALCVLMVGAPQIDSFEKQALSLVQAMPASELDAKLPRRSFARWLEQVLNTKARGAKTGMVWQLAVCGNRISRPDETGASLPACAELTALLPDRRRVFITISVGTFKERLIGKPTFFSAVIEQDEKLYPVRQLYDLPKMLAPRDSVSDRPANKRRGKRPKNRIVTLPDINAGHVQIVTLSDYTQPETSTIPGVPDLEEGPLPPYPLELENVSEGVLQSRAISRVKPVYSAYARKMNAIGTVKVEVTISEVGIVIDATAVSGPLALRAAAVDAARMWVFKPATFKDTPVKMKGVITFTFGPGER
jgi:TonB family protein